CARACVRARFAGNGMTTSTLALPFEASARVSFTDRRVVVAAGADADATTLGFVELCVNATANASSRGVGILEVSLSSCSSSSSSTTTTVSCATFFVFFPLGPVLLAPGQLFSNATCSTCTSSFEPALSPARAFPLAAVWRWRSDLRAPGGRGGTRTYAISCPCPLCFLVLRGLRRGGSGREEEEEESMDMMSSGSWSLSLSRWRTGGSDEVPPEEGEGRKRGVFDMWREGTRDCEDEERPEVPAKTGEG
ncbi:hypothetical protein EDB86DRAFT_2967691, partial [Lactarius hatsudake]